MAGLDPIILIYALQAIYSRCWPERFSYRPIERFWRLVMYGRRPVFVIPRVGNVKNNDPSLIEPFGVAA